MVCPKELVKEVRDDWWLDISDCSGLGNVPSCICASVNGEMKVQWGLWGGS